jgi:hypothetical protein
MLTRYARRDALMSDTIENEIPLPRPEFLVVLGLVPPVTIHDVKQAYLEKVKTVHPDHGGDAQEFIRVHEAYKKATEYAEFKAGRMQWLSRWVEQYAEQQRLIEELRGKGGEVTLESTEWAAQSIGDFATVLERMVAIRLSGPAIDDELLIHLGGHRRSIAGLKRLELLNSKVTSVGLRELHNFDNLAHLDLSGTPITLQAVEALLEASPRLESLGLRDCGIPWRSRLGLRFRHRGVSISP